jgi:hypothetical protein
VLRWSDNGMHHVAVPDVDPAALREFAQALGAGSGGSDVR